MTYLNQYKFNLKIINLSPFLIFLMVIISACDKVDEKDNTIVQTSENQKKYIELPATKKHPQGLIEVKFNKRKYRIPKEFFYVNSKGEMSSTQFDLSWPSLKSLKGSSIERVRRSDRLHVQIQTTERKRRVVSDEKLEKIMIERHGQPIKLEGFPDLLEYPSGGTRSHYRSIDNTVRWADGLPSYFHCGGGAISQGFVSESSPLTLTCSIEVSWLDGVLMDIRFSRRHIKDWKAIHGRVIDWFESYRIVNNVKGSN